MNTAATRTLTIGNTGNAPLTVSGISLPGRVQRQLVRLDCGRRFPRCHGHVCTGGGDCLRRHGDGEWRPDGGTNTLAISGRGVTQTRTLVWRNGATGQNIGWLMNGLAVASSAFLPTIADTNWEVKGVGDFDGDGQADVVWRNRARARTSSG